MTHTLDKDFRIICNEIIAENKSHDEWVEIESDDMFNQGNYSGGFDATEMEFCFSVFIDEKEYWFQVSLDGIRDILEERITELEIRKAEY